MKPTIFLLSAVLGAGVVAMSGISTSGQVKVIPTKSASEAATSLPDDLQAQSRAQFVLRLTYVLDATCEDAKSWKDVATAAKVQAKTADLLWQFGPESARVHLVQAWATASKVEEQQKERSRYRNESARTDARREVMLVARKRDPALAKQWLDEMTKEISEDKKAEPRGAFDDRTARSTVLLQMALQLADTDPQTAAGLAIESLQDGVSFGFQQVLLKLQEKNFDIAQQVFRAALTRLRSLGLSDPNELLILYSYLYSPGRVLAPATTDNRGNFQLAVDRNRPPTIAAAAQLNPALAAEFLNLAADLLLALPLPTSTADPEAAARTQISVINTLLAGIAARAPEKALALRSRASQIDADAHFSAAPLSSRTDVPERREGETPSSYSDRRVDALVEAAEKERTTLGRDIAYAKAALATTVERYKRGLELAHKIDEESLRLGVANWLIYRATLHLVATRDYEQAYRLIAKSTEPIQRAASLIAASQESLKAQEADVTRARQWLEEARALTAKADSEENRARVAWGIVSTYGQFDRTMALRSFSEAVHWLNQIETPVKDDDRAPLVRRFSGIGNLSDFTYGTKGFSLQSALKVFGTEQFDELLSVINTISVRETRGIGVVLLCEQNLKALLANEAKERPKPVK